MKIPYKYFTKKITPNPSIEELSDKLFQLGHEHEINNNIFEFELTPNRGDCISLIGLYRDLRLFYNIDVKENIYMSDINSFSFEFSNNADESTEGISFLKIEIDKIPSKYNDVIESYFVDLNLNKNNFFTDISNYISYETGQPTHCYDSSKINEPIRLDFLDKDSKFDTLLGKVIDIKKNDLVFFDRFNEVINLAGVVGSNNTSCSKNTKSIIVECAHFDSELIMGKSVRYGINSDAAHKFERNVDPCCHEYVLRRFLYIIQEHTNITNVQIFTKKYSQSKSNLIEFDSDKINDILGTNISADVSQNYLTKLGFTFTDNYIEIPSFRGDIFNINDIAEEIARAVGYEKVKPINFNIEFKNNSFKNLQENEIKNLLTNSGFYEVINDPFVSKKTSEALKIDNPLDSNRKYLRTDLKQSLIKNLIYNERRQKETIKLFEIADVYSSNSISTKRVIGIIASGRVGQNYQDFSRKIDKKYLKNVLQDLKDIELDFEEISRETIDSKIKNKIFYIEITIDKSFKIESDQSSKTTFNIHNKRYVPISEFPLSNRDLSFSIKNFKKCKILEKSILNFEHDLIKEIFVFDYYKNEKLKEIKIGFRFIFQSKNTTITDIEVNKVMESIITKALSIDSVHIPGL